MKRKLKKSLAIILATLTLFSFASATKIEDICNLFYLQADAWYYPPSYYLNEDGSVTIRSYNYNNDSVLGTHHVPARIDGYEVTAIGDGAYTRCEKMTDVVISDSIKNIGNGAFSHCTGLKSVTIPENVIKIGNAPFIGCSNLTKITVAQNNLAYSNDENFILYTKDKTTLIQYPNGKPENEFEIPNHVKNIGVSCFSCSDNLTDVIIPDSVKSIGNGAFSHCENLKSISISNGVNLIGNEAFAYCKDLQTIFIPNSVTSIGNEAFRASGLTSITIPENITKIESGTFLHCRSLGSIIIPDSITYIDVNAFSQCGIHDVYYAGSYEDWSKITIETEGNEKLLNATIHFNYKHEHEYTTESDLATCTENGIIKYTCQCGYSYTESIPATGHTAGAWETVLEPTTETEGKKIKKCTVCGKTVEEETIAKLPKEPVKDNAVVKSPSTSSISYGDSIVLHVDASKIPEGGYVEWTASNGNFNWSVNGETCTISPEKSGDTTFTATIYDADGNAVSTDVQTMTSKAGFFDKIIAFFKGIFGLNKTYPSVFKF